MAKVVPITQSAGESRTGLANAIAEGRRSRDVSAQTSASIERCQELLQTRRAQKDAADAAIEKVRRIAVGSVIRAAKTNAMPREIDSGGASVAQGEAADKVVAAEEALSALEEEKRRAATAAAWTMNGVHTERNKIIAIEAEPVLARAIELRREQAIVSAQLSELMRVGREAPNLDALNPVAQLRAAEQRAEPLVAIKRRIDDFMITGGHPINEDREAARIKAAELHSALGRLLEDPMTKIEV
ncbi:MAG: hypothetical protein ACLP19_18200 [Xanthobacteraceae bacterium]